MQSLTDLLQTFIGFRTVAGNDAVKSHCLDWIAKTFLSQSGIAPERGAVAGAPYLFLRHPHARLLWFGHVDVVPGSDAQFTMCIEGDKAVGRGVKDMKGADLAFLIAYRDACAAGSVPPVSILLTSDEETGGRTPKELLERDALGAIPVAYTPDTGETDGIVTELKGGLWVRIVAEGKSGHAAMPWANENPIPRLFDAVAAITKHFPVGTADDWRATVTPTMLAGSDIENRVPDEASCLLDVRFPPSTWKSSDEALRSLHTFLPPRCRLETVRHADPMFCDSSHPMVQMLKVIAEDVLGAPVAMLREPGASDARYFTARGIPAFLYGPIGGDLHGAHEWVSLPSLRNQVDINRRWLAELSIP